MDSGVRWIYLIGLLSTYVGPPRLINDKLVDSNIQSSVSAVQPARAYIFLSKRRNAANDAINVDCSDYQAGKGHYLSKANRRMVPFVPSLSFLPPLLLIASRSKPHIEYPQMTA